MNPYDRETFKQVTTQQALDLLNPDLTIEEQLRRDFAQCGLMSDDQHSAFAVRPACSWRFWWTGAGASCPSSRPSRLPA